MEEIELTIVDDPANAHVFKGPGHFAATRAEAAIRKLESEFPQLRFDLAVDQRLASLKATAVVTVAINSVEFIAALADALATTGTRTLPTAYLQRMANADR